MKLFAGYDGGGTKTACVLADENGRLLGTGIGGPSNYLYCGKELAAASVREATSQAFAQAGLEVRPLKAAYMASAAILLQHGDYHVPFFSTCIDAETVICESDIYPIWYGAASGKPAVVSIAGTGAITYVCRNDEFIRVGGWGPLLGDEGSGYDLGFHALRTACRMADGRVEADTAFVDALFGQFDVHTPRELLVALNRGDTRSKVASAAYTVSQLYAAGNQTAAQLLDYCAEEIALAVTTAVSKDPSGEVLPLVLSGSLVRPERPLFPMIREKLRKTTDRIGDVLAPEVHPAAASAALALHCTGFEEGAMQLLKNAKGVLL